MSENDVIAFGDGQELYAKAKRLIPGGTQLLSKRPEMHLPDQWPSYYNRAQGPYIWDLDERRLLDMSYSGFGACVLGYADPDVDQAVQRAISLGTMTTLNCPEEVELAELLLHIHPWAEMVRYARTGGEAMAVAVRIARAVTGRAKIAFCGYHGWHDWYLAANLAKDTSLDGHLLPGLAPNGVPDGLQGTMFPFRYNQIGELEQIVDSYGGELAAVVMEPIRDRDPEPGFLERIRGLTTEIGAVLVFDEITSGWRLVSGSAHLLYEVEPDIAVFAKGISNGYPMAAIIGLGAVMEAAQRSFISSTYWTERIGPTAALATIRKHQELNVSEHLIEVGQQIQAGWQKAADCHHLRINISGIPPLGYFSFDFNNGQAVRTLFTQLMLTRGVLATSAFYAMYAHQKEHVDQYLTAVDEVFSILAQAVSNETVEQQLNGPVAHTGFSRLT